MYKLHLSNCLKILVYGDFDFIAIKHLNRRPICRSVFNIRILY